MAAGEPTYCVDTSALIHAWRRAYPPRHFPPIWNRIDGLIEAGRLLSSIEVLNELKKRDDHVFAWAKEREAIFLDIEGDELQHRMQALMGTYPRLVDTRKNRSAADPFVIGVALIHNPPLVVVSQEGATNNLDKPNIPDVCAAEGVDCIDILRLIEQEDWILG